MYICMYVCMHGWIDGCMYVFIYFFIYVGMLVYECIIILVPGRSIPLMPIILTIYGIVPDQHQMCLISSLSHHTHKSHISLSSCLSAGVGAHGAAWHHLWPVGS